MKNYVKIQKGTLSVSDKNGNTVKLPSRVNFGMRNYRFDPDRQMLQKRCTNCKEYFDTDEIIGGEFVDVHDENLIREHRGKSEMYSRCVECHDALKEEQVLRDAQKFNIELHDRSSVKKQSDSMVNEELINPILFSDENLQYIKLVAVLKNMTADQYLNELIELIRKHNKLKIEFEEKIK
ncbi:MAG: hypothetical protein K8R73_08300 [Clostridiales bacterium]|nr:hypothetical protein [Clostridiales bacterium]